MGRLDEKVDIYNEWMVAMMFSLKQVSNHLFSPYGERFDFTAAVFFVKWECLGLGPGSLQS